MAIIKFPCGPGKTPPRLIEDLLDYDPRYVSKKNGRNVLADPAPQYRGQLLYRRGLHDCRHQLVRKDNQTRVPFSDDELPNPSSEYVVGAFCVKCRYHFKITISYSTSTRDFDACQLSNPVSPLHHLVTMDTCWINGQATPSEATKYKGVSVTHRYACSVPKCPAIVIIEIWPPRMSENLLRLIEDPVLLEARGKKEILADPVRFINERPLLPFKALVHLRTFVLDAMKHQGEMKKVATRNKKYRLTFADDCNKIFDYLDFKYIEEEVEGDEPNSFWGLPDVSENNIDFLQDVSLELCCRAFELAPTDYPPDGKQIVFNPVPALTDIQLALGCLNYPKRSKHIDIDTLEHPYYASLGIVEDFTDDFVSWAYDRQCQCDTINKPYYLDCLEDLAQGRESSELQVKFVMATSAGEIGLKGLEEAYKYFGLDLDTKEPDEHIIGLYMSRIESAPRQKDEAKSYLRVIAKHRESSKIEITANDNTMTFTEALDFLNVTEETPSDSIEAAAVVLSTDGDRAKVARALQVIAKQRPDDMTAQRAAAACAFDAGEGPIDITEAYKCLQIPSSTVSDESVLNYYQSLSDGAGIGPKESFRESLRAIAVERNSRFLLAKLQDPNADVQASIAEPVGLDNIGNTCYLNSLLQYYYTVKPLREMVMDFDKYRMLLTDENVKRKKVGGRQVEKAEIIKAQKFVDELSDLFKKLKTASTRSVRPTKELAALTIFSTTAEQNARRQSVSSPGGPPNIETITCTDFIGPRLPPPPNHPPPIAEEALETCHHSSDIMMENGDNCSEATLVDTELPSYNQIESIEDIQQLYPQDGLMDVKVVEDADMINVTSNYESPKVPQAPEKVPPIPPRNKSGLVISTTESRDLTAVDKMWDFGSQQDVTEVIGNVLFRLQCAIAATGYEEDSNEQIDLIRDTFFGANTVYTQKIDSLQKKIEAWSHLLVFPGLSGSRDIYEALDVTLDEQIVEIDHQPVPQYTSISKLPRVMQFHIQRTAFTNGRSWKNRSPVTFPETLYLDRYMDSEPDSGLMHRRRETWKWKKQLLILEARYEALTQNRSELNVPGALGAIKDYISTLQEEEIEGISIDPDLPDLLDARVSEIAQELDDISEKILTLKQRLKAQFMDLRQFPYKLHSVFIHHGEATGGHYWVYIYDSNQDVWRQYNDEYVTEVRNRDYIFKHETIGAGTPYYVVYVRSAELKDLVDPVCRELQDVDMSEAMSEVTKMSDDISMITNGTGEDLTRHTDYRLEPRVLRPKIATENSGTAAWHWNDDGAKAQCDANGNEW